MNIAYILHKFPQTSETFIINEILALQKSKPDISLAIISLQRPKKRAIHDSANNLEVDYLADIAIDILQLTAYLLKKMLCYPRKVLQSMYYLLKSPRGNKLYFYLIRYWYSLYLLFRLGYQLEKKQIQHLHSHFGNTPSLFTLCASLITAIPFSFTTHARDIFVYKELLQEKHRYASFTITISQFNKTFIEKQYAISKNTLHVVPCGIDLSYFTFTRYPRHDSETFNIISIGRLVEKKGFLFLINACKHLQIPFRCDIIGTGPLYDDLKERINILGLEGNVLLHGEQSQENVRSMLNQSDVFVLPCVKDSDGDMDGSPMVLKEAMAMGVICISTRLSGIPELLQDAGILVAPEAEQELYQAIKHVFNMSIDEKNNLAKAQRKVIENYFNLTQQIDQLYRLFSTSVKKD